MKLTDMSEKQITKYTGENIMDWEWQPMQGPTLDCGRWWDKKKGVDGLIDGPFHPLTDANDDVKVLDVVRKWNSYRLVEFSVLLGKLYSERNQTFAWEINFSMYEIGDYTRSAVAVMLAKKETGDE